MSKRPTKRSVKLALEAEVHAQMEKLYAQRHAVGEEIGEAIRTGKIGTALGLIDWALEIDDQRAVLWRHLCRAAVKLLAASGWMKTPQRSGSTDSQWALMKPISRSRRTSAKSGSH